MASEFSKTAVALVALMKIRGVGRRAAIRVVGKGIRSEFDESAVYERAARHKIDVNLLRSWWERSEEELSKSIEAGIRVFAFSDDLFPARLRTIPDPPAILYVKGDNRGLRMANTLAVVGTREPTDYGQRVSKKLASSAVESGFGIVSGLAHGCDTFAHEGCLDARGVGIAVLAHGLDKVYPAANKGLAKRLLDGGGCLVSEYPVGMTPLRTAFAERDRIQSGLSDGVLVIETDVKGGTMHTVNFSRQQQRILACIDHPDVWLSEPKVQGNRQMIADRWAEPIANGEALNRFLEKLKQRPVAQQPHMADDDAQGKMDF